MTTLYKIAKHKKWKKNKRKENDQSVENTQIF